MSITRAAVGTKGEGVIKTTTAYRWRQLRDELDRMRGMDAYQAVAAINARVLDGQADDDAMLSLEMDLRDFDVVERASMRLDGRGIGYRPEDNAMRPDAV